LLRVKGFRRGRLQRAGGGAVRAASRPPAGRVAKLADGDRQSRVVFISRNISEAQVRDLFKAVRALV
jgi:hypothetical protein